MADAANPAIELGGFESTNSAVRRDSPSSAREGLEFAQSVQLTVQERFIYDANRHPDFVRLGQLSSDRVGEALGEIIRLLQLTNSEIKQILKEHNLGSITELSTLIYISADGSQVLYDQALSAVIFDKVVRGIGLEAAHGQEPRFGGRISKAVDAFSSILGSSKDKLAAKAGELVSFYTSDEISTLRKAFTTVTTTISAPLKLARVTATLPANATANLIKLGIDATGIDSALETAWVKVGGREMALNIERVAMLGMSSGDRAFRRMGEAIGDYEQAINYVQIGDELNPTLAELDPITRSVMLGIQTNMNGTTSAFLEQVLSEDFLMQGLVNLNPTRYKSADSVRASIQSLVYNLDELRTDKKPVQDPAELLLIVSDVVKVAKSHIGQQSGFEQEAKGIRDLSVILFGGISSDMAMQAVRSGTNLAFLINVAPALFNSVASSALGTINGSQAYSVFRSLETITQSPKQLKQLWSVISAKEGLTKTNKIMAMGSVFAGTAVQTFAMQLDATLGLGVPFSALLSQTINSASRFVPAELFDDDKASDKLLASLLKYYAFGSGLAYVGDSIGTVVAPRVPIVLDTVAAAATSANQLIQLPAIAAESLVQQLNDLPAVQIDSGEDPVAIRLETTDGSTAHAFKDELGMLVVSITNDVGETSLHLLSQASAAADQAQEGVTELLRVFSSSSRQGEVTNLESDTADDPKLVTTRVATGYPNFQQDEDIQQGFLTEDVEDSDPYRQPDIDEQELASQEGNLAGAEAGGFMDPESGISLPAAVLRGLDIEPEAVRDITPTEIVENSSENTFTNAYEVRTEAGEVMTVLVADGEGAGEADYLIIENTERGLRYRSLLDNDRFLIDDDGEVKEIKSANQGRRLKRAGGSDSDDSNLNRYRRTRADAEEVVDSEPATLTPFENYLPIAEGEPLNENGHIPLEGAFDGYFVAPGAAGSMGAGNVDALVDGYTVQGFEVAYDAAGNPAQLLVIADSHTDGDYKFEIAANIPISSSGNDIPVNIGSSTFYAQMDEGRLVAVTRNTLADGGLSGANLLQYTSDATAIEALRDKTEDDGISIDGSSADVAGRNLSKVTDTQVTSKFGRDVYIDSEGGNIGLFNAYENPDFLATTGEIGFDQAGQPICLIIHRDGQVFVEPLNPVDLRPGDDRDNNMIGIANMQVKLPGASDDGTDRDVFLQFSPEADGKLQLIAITARAVNIEFNSGSNLVGYDSEGLKRAGVLQMSYDFDTVGPNLQSGVKLDLVGGAAAPITPTDTSPAGTTPATDTTSTGTIPTTDTTTTTPVTPQTDLVGDGPFTDTGTGLVEQDPTEAAPGREMATGPDPVQDLVIQTQDLGTDLDSAVSNFLSDANAEEVMLSFTPPIDPAAAVQQDSIAEVELIRGSGGDTTALVNDVDESSIDNFFDIVNLLAANPQLDKVIVDPGVAAEVANLFAGADESRQGDIRSFLEGVTAGNKLYIGGRDGNIVVSGPEGLGIPEETIDTAEETGDQGTGTAPQIVEAEIDVEAAAAVDNTTSISGFAAKLTELTNSGDYVGQIVIQDGNGNGTEDATLLLDGTTGTYTFDAIDPGLSADEMVAVVEQVFSQPQVPIVTPVTLSTITQILSSDIDSVNRVNIQQIFQGVQMQDDSLDAVREITLDDLFPPVPLEQLDLPEATQEPIPGEQVTEFPMNLVLGSGASADYLRDLLSNPPAETGVQTLIMNSTEGEVEATLTFDTDLNTVSVNPTSREGALELDDAYLDTLEQVIAVAEGGARVFTFQEPTGDDTFELTAEQALRFRDIVIGNVYLPGQEEVINQESFPELYPIIQAVIDAELVPEATRPTQPEPTFTPTEAVQLDQVPDLPEDIENALGGFDGGMQLEADIEPLTPDEQSAFTGSFRFAGRVLGGGEGERLFYIQDGDNIQVYRESQDDGERVFTNVLTDERFSIEAGGLQLLQPEPIQPTLDPSPEPEETLEPEATEEVMRTNFMRPDSSPEIESLEELEVSLGENIGINGRAYIDPETGFVYDITDGSDNATPILVGRGVNFGAGKDYLDGGNRAIITSEGTVYDSAGQEFGEFIGETGDHIDIQRPGDFEVRLYSDGSRSAVIVFEADGQEFILPYSSLRPGPSFVSDLEFEGENYAVYAGVVYEKVETATGEIELRKVQELLSRNYEGTAYVFREGADGMPEGEGYYHFSGQGLAFEIFQNDVFTVNGVNPIGSALILGDGVFVVEYQGEDYLLQNGVVSSIGGGYGSLGAMQGLINNAIADNLDEYEFGMLPPGEIGSASTAFWIISDPDSRDVEFRIAPDPGEPTQVIKLSFNESEEAIVDISGVDPDMPPGFDDLLSRILSRVDASNLDVEGQVSNVEVSDGEVVISLEDEVDERVVEDVELFTRLLDLPNSDSVQYRGGVEAFKQLYLADATWGFDTALPRILDDLEISESDLPETIPFELVLGSGKQIKLALTPDLEYNSVKVTILDRTNLTDAEIAEIPLPDGEWEWSMNDGDISDALILQLRSTSEAAAAAERLNQVTPVVLPAGIFIALATGRVGFNAIRERRRRRRRSRVNEWYRRDVKSVVFENRPGDKYTEQEIGVRDAIRIVGQEVEEPYPFVGLIKNLAQVIENPKELAKALQDIEIRYQNEENPTAAVLGFPLAKVESLKIKGLKEASGIRNLHYTYTHGLGINLQTVEIDRKYRIEAYNPTELNFYQDNTVYDMWTPQLMKDDESVLLESAGIIYKNDQYINFDLGQAVGGLTVSQIRFNYRKKADSYTSLGLQEPGIELFTVIFEPDLFLELEYSGVAGYFEVISPPSDEITEPKLRELLGLPAKIDLTSSAESQNQINFRDYNTPELAKLFPDFNTYRGERIGDRVRIYDSQQQLVFSLLLYGNTYIMELLSEKEVVLQQSPEIKVRLGKGTGLELGQNFELQNVIGQAHLDLGNDNVVTLITDLGKSVPQRIFRNGKFTMPDVELEHPIVIRSLRLAGGHVLSDKLQGEELKLYKQLGNNPVMRINRGRILLDLTYDGNRITIGFDPKSQQFVNLKQQ